MNQEVLVGVPGVLEEVQDVFGEVLEVIEEVLGKIPGVFRVITPGLLVKCSVVVIVELPATVKTNSRIN